MVLTGAGQLEKQALSLLQTSGIAMSAVRHVNKIPTIRGTDIMRDPRLNKVIQKNIARCDSRPGHDGWHDLVHVSANRAVFHFQKFYERSFTMRCIFSVFSQTKKSYLCSALVVYLTGHQGCCCC